MWIVGLTYKAGPCLSAANPAGPGCASLQAYWALNEVAREMEGERGRLRAHACAHAHACRSHAHARQTCMHAAAPQRPCSRLPASLPAHHCSPAVWASLLGQRRQVDGSTVIRLLASPARHLTSALAPPHPAPHPHPPSADPYCFEPNDIPLPRLQYQFNERLLAAANSQAGRAGPGGQPGSSWASAAAASTARPRLDLLLAWLPKTRLACSRMARLALRSHP